jgi:hypothetical protein
MVPDIVTGAAIVASLTDEQAKAVQNGLDLGKTVVKETSALARYMARIVGTVPEDAVGFVLGDPLRAVRTVVAAKLDEWVQEKLRRRNVTDPQPISPSLAIPIMRAAYDETRPELQELWASLIAAAMDPKRRGFVRLRFVATVKELDPLDALALRELGKAKMEEGFHKAIADQIGVSSQEFALSIENLARLGCIAPGQTLPSEYGRALLRACEA